MKTFGWLRIGLFQIGFLVGVFWLLSGSGQPASARAVLSAGSGVQARTGMNSGSCPMKGMKGTLPCCKHTAKASICRASICDVCLLSDVHPAEISPKILRNQAPVVSILFIAAFGPPENLPVRPSIFGPFSSSPPFALPVNRPLLI